MTSKIAMTDASDWVVVVVVVVVVVSFWTTCLVSMKKSIESFNEMTSKIASDWLVVVVVV